ncbi:hypothetical protein I552_10133 [Mycobacterium xenopi 3993]|nr:hypothetical protein I552_10133 [Mycobacterium xenopi 3993]
MLTPRSIGRSAWLDLRLTTPSSTGGGTQLMSKPSCHCGAVGIQPGRNAA